MFCMNYFLKLLLPKFAKLAKFSKSAELFASIQLFCRNILKKSIGRQEVRGIEQFPGLWGKYPEGNLGIL